MELPVGSEAFLKLLSADVFPPMHGASLTLFQLNRQVRFQSEN